jgi:invasion protein IalB
MVGVTGSIPVAPTISEPPIAFARCPIGQALAARKATIRRGIPLNRGPLLTTLALCLALIGAFARPGFAQGVIKDKHGDWETRCETPPGAAYEQCAVVLSVVDRDRPNLTLVVIVINTADRKARLMRVIAPLGVLLPSGVSLRVDDQDVGHLSFLQCLANGCIAQLALDDKILDALKNGKTATLGIFQTPEQGVGVLAPLAGFKEGYEQLP